MTVRIEKPAINVREELADLRKPTGIAGEAMLRAETPQEQFNLIGAGRRNRIINGNFDVWQRGSSSISSDGFFADRWQMFLSSATATASQESFTLGQTDVPNNPSYFAKLDVTTGNNQARLEHRVEYVTTFAGQTTTLSFYAKGTNPNGGTVEVDLTHRYGSGGSSSVSVTKTITLASSWQRFTLNFDVPSVSGKTIGAGDYVQLSWRQPAADTSTNAWNISLAQVQWELGKVATPFEHRSYGEELAACQRYYQNNGLTSTDRIYTFQYNVSYKGLQYSYFCPMRAVPTITRTNGGNTITLGSITNQKFFGYVASGASDATPHYLHTVSFDAEL